MKFLGRAKKFLQDLGTEPPAKVQYFNVICASGHRVRGERTEGYQALRCPSCGDGVFVLPRSPLPEPVTPARAGRSRASSSRPGGGFVEEGPVQLTDLPRAGVDADDRGLANGDAEIIWDDEPAPPRSRRGTSAAPPAGPGPGVVSDADFDRIADEETRRASAREDGPEAPRRGRPKPADPDPSRPTEIQPGRRNGPAAEARGKPSRRPADGMARPARARVDLDAVSAAVSGPRARPRRRISLGMIFVLLSALVVTTVGWRIWRQRRQEYPLIAEKGRLEGIPALEQGDFDKAHNLLSAAKKAVDALGGGIEDADEIRRAADEADILVNLCIQKLEDLLAEATPTEEWAQKFDTLYKGQSYIFETRVVAAPAEGTSGDYEIDYLVLPPGEATRFGDGGMARVGRFARIDLTGFELFELAHTAKGHSVLFGAKLASFRFDNEKNYWVVKLEPKSGVFMTHTRALESLGWPEPDLTDSTPDEGPR